MVLCRIPPALTVCGFLSQTSDHEAARPNPAAATAEPSAAPAAAAQQPSPNPALMLDSPPNPVGVHPAPAYTGHRGVQGTMQLASATTFAGDRCNSRSASTRRRTHRPGSAGPTSTLDSGYPITTTCTSSPRAAVRYTGTRCGKLTKFNGSPDNLKAESGSGPYVGSL